MKKTLITIYEPTKRFKTEEIETDSFVMPTISPDDRYIMCDNDEKSVYVNNLTRDGYYNFDLLKAIKLMKKRDILEILLLIIIFISTIVYVLIDDIYILN